MPESGTSGSVGAVGGQPPTATRRAGSGLAFPRLSRSGAILSCQKNQQVIASIEYLGEVRGCFRRLVQIAPEISRLPIAIGPSCPVDVGLSHRCAHRVR